MIKIWDFIEFIQYDHAGYEEMICLFDDSREWPIYAGELNNDEELLLWGAFQNSKEVQDLYWKWKQDFCPEPLGLDCMEEGKKARGF